MKFHIGQRVRIRYDAHVERPFLSRFKGEIVHIVAPYVCLGSNQPWYELDAKVSGTNIVAAESALEPVYDGNTKLSWAETTGRIVWSPFTVPAVMRRNRTTPA